MRPSPPSPLSRPYGRGGARREAVGGEGLYRGLSKTLTSQAFGLGPSSPAESGRGDQGPSLGSFPPSRMMRRVSTTPSIFCRMSWFQKRTRRNPRRRRRAVLARSARGLCCPPSASTISFRSRQTKSATNGPKLCCCRNFHPSRRPRNLDQSSRSASVEWRRNRAACGLTWRFTGGMAANYQRSERIPKALAAETPLPFYGRGGARRGAVGGEGL